MRFTIPSQSAALEAGRSPEASESSVDAAPTGPTVNSGSQFERDLELHVEGSQEVLAQDRLQAGRAVASDEPVLQQAATAEPTDPAATDSPEPSGGEHRAVTPPPAPAAVVDPLAEAPAAVWYVRPPSGGQFGPAQPDLVQTWLNEGRISPETFVWREGWADWREAASVFPSLQPAVYRATEPPVVSAPSALPAGSPRRPERRKTGPHLGLIVVLALAVVLLLAIFLWILQSGFGHRGAAGHRGAGAVEGTLVLLPQSGLVWHPGG